MRIRFEVYPDQEKMNVTATYDKGDPATPFFYLNRDFTILSILCDGIETYPEIEPVELRMFDGYIANKIMIPEYRQLLEVRYVGILTGKTGCCPYVRERIGADFTFLRWESFCYPLFFRDDWDSFRTATGALCTVELIIPVEYEAVSMGIPTHIEHADGKRFIRYQAERMSNSLFNCAIAKYSKIQSSIGTLYVLHAMDEEKRQEVERTLEYAYAYMNAHFGHRDIGPNIVFAAIPDGFGSFADRERGVIFVQESTFQSISTLNQIVHEYIHLGWNALPDDSVQRSRFFDEAFTSYFEMRVMRSIIGPDYALRRAIDRALAAIAEGQYKCVPICEYGQYKYGDLSYTIGALCLEELCALMGESTFDRATAAFLEAYKETPADFPAFCEAYLSFCEEQDRAKLQTFFDDWIYTCHAIRRYLPV